VTPAELQGLLLEALAALTPQARRDLLAELPLTECPICGAELRTGEAAAHVPDCTTPTEAP
jgi:hypothetical protein